MILLSPGVPLRIRTSSGGLIMSALATISPVLAAESEIATSNSFAWIAPARTSGAVYFSVSNMGGSNDRIVSVHADIAKRTELHKMEVGNDGIVRMRRIEEGIPIAAGDTVELAPGGTHVMLMGLEEAPEIHGMVKVTLTLESGTEITVLATVRQQGDMPGAN